MAPHLWPIIVFTIVASVLSAPAAHAKDFFRSSPGELSASHGSIDGQEHCNDCHSGGRRVADKKCIGCHEHKKLAKRIKSGKGFHSTEQVTKRSCGDCHLEHKGRDYDIMAWQLVGGMQSFDHRDASWPLEGKHTNIKCTDCHRRRNRQGLRLFLGEVQDCGACHRGDQPHGFQKRALMRCERCHTQRVWKPARRNSEFDHNNPRDAALPLRGAHEDVRCSKCHPKARFNRAEKDPAACSNCHESPHDDHLFGRRKCRQCHAPTARSIAQVSFKHTKHTRFPLGASHKRQQCYKCHTDKLGKRKPKRTCESCHADQNGHKQRFKEFGDPPRCNLCHLSAGWQPRGFNHDKKTRFRLTGRHASATCRSCHRGQRADDFERFNPDTIGCMGCHAHEKVHNGERADATCLDCHRTAGQKKIKKSAVAVFHEGDEATFPLVQGHSGLECARCHKQSSSGSTSKACGDRCHQDSLHRSTLGSDCNRCHTSGIWAATRFDHTDDTDWPLKGRHAKGAECAACHPTRQYDGTPKECSAAGCHARDDVHEGTLGDQCDRCHRETGQLVFDHNRMSSFTLDGRHQTTRCTSCHPAGKFKPRVKECFGCHSEPRKHAGMYGTRCEKCHSTATWLDIEALHDNGAFALRGAHDRTPCTACHVDSRRLSGTGNLCINCHRNDDVHSNGLSPRCGECHTQWSFAPARFDHTAVGCFLTGSHRIMPCYDCHKSGQFSGLNSQCYGCHLDDAERADFPHGPGLGQCSGCHNPSYWSPANQSGKESICR